MLNSFFIVGAPLFALNHHKLAEFVEKHTKHTLPKETHARKAILKRVYDDNMEEILNDTGSSDDPLWFSVDETIDIGHRYVFTGQ